MQHKTDYVLNYKKNIRSESTLVLILLNYHLPCFTPQLWGQVSLRVCTDGGANRLYDELPLLFPSDDPADIRHKYKPDVIRGDLDSIRPNVKECYSKMGTTIIDQTNDQETTDLHKCVIYIRDFTPDLDKTHLKILVVGALGGRFDHEAANIDVLHTFANVLHIVLLSEESSLTLLAPGYLHKIHINCSFEGPHCGLIPLGAPSTSTTTTGLHWNLSDTPMAFGSLISTCNILESDIVTVQSDAYLLWTTEIRFEP
ncbi:unnamed protein product [Sphagnum troendelagicum]|uniref:Thiamine pyrophosphokinase n=1 Tax=Sphagnum troendelagicum TaxID=128251 RepID=A0ABP0TZL0_9BRYO